MIFKRLTREQSRMVFDRYFKNETIDSSLFDDLDSDYLRIREDLMFYLENKPDVGEYNLDLYFATRIYEYFNSIKGFDENVAEDYDFWRYICIKVIPELVMLRHGLDPKYYFEQTNRMYVPTMWWYIHMSYNEDIDTTTTILRELSTDYIMQLVDRKGRYGFYLSVSREIMRCISLIPRATRNHKENGKVLFRRVMIQNTAISENYNLAVENATKEYVYKLFKACKVEVGKYENSIGTN